MLPVPERAAEIQLKPAEISDQELEDAGLGPYVERTINANGSRCRIVQLTFRLLLSKSPLLDLSNGVQADKQTNGSFRSPKMK